MSLKVEHVHRGSLSVMKVTGFTEKQLSELNSMDYRDMKSVLMDTLLSGRLIPYGNYIINAWVNDGTVFVETEVCKF